MANKGFHTGRSLPRGRPVHFVPPNARQPCPLLRHSCESRNPEGQDRGASPPPPTTIPSLSSQRTVGAIRESDHLEALEGPSRPRRERPRPRPPALAVHAPQLSPFPPHPLRHSCEGRNPEGPCGKWHPLYRPTTIPSLSSQRTVGAIRESNHPEALEACPEGTRRGPSRPRRQRPRPPALAVHVPQLSSFPPPSSPPSSFLRRQESRGAVRRGASPPPPNHPSPSST